MRTALVALLLAGCHDELVEPWQLDHDRIVAARAEPAGIVTGEVALLDGLVAHAGGTVTTEPPTGATAPDAPAGLFTAVHFLFDHWQIDAPDAAAMSDAQSFSITALTVFTRCELQPVSERYYAAGA